MTRQELTSALRRTGLVHEDAVEDPEGWDGCVTEARIGKLHAELFPGPSAEELAAKHAAEVAELNQRLIERQESFTAQVVRIEATWRERLRDKVGLNWQVPGENSPAVTGKYLVELHDGTHTMVRFEETFEEYEDGTLADRSEWRAWAEVPQSGK